MLRFVIGALALVTPASAVLFEHDLFRATCAGGVYWMPGSNVEVGMDMSSGLDQQEAFYAGVYQEAKQACPALADEEFQRRFVPGLHSVVNMLDKNSKLTSTCPGVFARGFATDAPWTLMDKTMVGVKSPVAQLMMGISPLHALSQAYNVGASDEVNKGDEENPLKTSVEDATADGQWICWHCDRFMSKAQLRCSKPNCRGAQPKAK